MTNRKDIIILLFVFIATFVIFQKGYTMEGLRWATDSQVQKEYEHQAYEFWAKKDTPYLIKHFKVRAKSRGDSFLFAKPVKYRIDYKIILSILKQRFNDEGVLECFLEVIKKDPYKAREIIPAIALYYDKGIDVTRLFIEIYKDCSKSCELVKYYIVKTLKDRKIRVNALVPYIKDELMRTASPLYLDSAYKEKRQYLKFMGEIID